jgi:hypothetical protein
MAVQTVDLKLSPKSYDDQKAEHDWLAAVGPAFYGITVNPHAPSDHLYLK